MSSRGWLYQNRGPVAFWSIVGLGIVGWLVWKWLSSTTEEAFFYYNRGAASLRRDDYDSAIKDFDEAIRLDPEDADFYKRRGDAWLGKDDYDRAIKDYDIAILLDPNYASAYNDRGLAWKIKKEYQKALRDYDVAIRLDPNDFLAHARLTWMLAASPDKSVRDGKLAIQLATRACELTHWQNVGVLESLAAAHAEAGHFEEAKHYQRKALELDDPDLRKKYGDEARQRLQLYKQKKPYRENP